MGGLFRTGHFNRTGHFRSRGLQRSASDLDKLRKNEERLLKELQAQSVVNRGSVILPSQARVESSIFGDKNGNGSSVAPVRGTQQSDSINSLKENVNKLDNFLQDN